MGKPTSANKKAIGFARWLSSGRPADLSDRDRPIERWPAGHRSRAASKKRLTNSARAWQELHLLSYMVELSVLILGADNKFEGFLNF